MAPWARDRPGSGTTSVSSYSSPAPKPLHPGQAPRGLLKENSAGVSTGPAVPQREHVGCWEKRRRDPLSSATATPSPSLNAVATASASRPRRRDAVHHHERLRRLPHPPLGVVPVEPHDRAVELRPHEAGSPQLSGDLHVGAMGGGGQGKSHEDWISLSPFPIPLFQQVVHHLLHGISLHDVAAPHAVRRPGPRP